VIAYRATLDVPAELVHFVARLLLAERHRRGTHTAAAADLPTLADPGYDGAGIGIHVPVKQPAGGRELDTGTAPSTRYSSRFAASASGDSPCSPVAGGRSSTSPPAPARSAISHARRLSSPISSTATSNEFL